MSDTINLIREEIAELEKLIEDARDQGVPDDDPAVRGYLRTLLARRELAEELEELDWLRLGGVAARGSRATFASPLPPRRR